MPLVVENLRVRYPIRKGVFARTVGWVNAVDGVSIDVADGETLGIVGESGSGKSTLARAVLRLVRPCEGRITFDGEDVLSLSGKRLMEYRRRVQVVFQDPLASLNPRHTVERIVTDGAIVHGLCNSSDRRRVAADLLESVGLDASMLDRFPHEFSGGQRQRISIARAISLRPKLLICDEAVSALDLSVRAQVLDLLADLRRRMGLSMLFITHDIGVVNRIADRLVVMHDGKLVESGKTAEVIANPREEYTRYLMSAVPRIRHH